MKPSYTIPQQNITIPLNGTTSNVFTISDVDKVFIIAPIVLTQTVTLEFSIDNGTTWRNPLATPLTMSQGTTLDTARLAACSGLFSNVVKWRLSQSTAAVADRVFVLIGIK